MQRFMLSGAWQENRNHSVVFMTSVSVTNRTDTRHSGFPVSRQTAAASLGLCVCVEGKRVDFWENKAKIEGSLHGAHPACLLPLSVKYKAFIFWQPNNVADSNCEQASKKQISLVIHKWKASVRVTGNVFPLIEYGTGLFRNTDHKWNSGQPNYVGNWVRLLLLGRRNALRMQWSG